MFGSLRIARRHVDEQARLAHRAAFCASCHALRELGSIKTSLLTNHDQTVLAMLLAALEPARRTGAAACTALPWRTITVAPLAGPSRQLLAAANVAAVEAKLEDDAVDEGGLLPRLGLRFLGKDRSRARELLRGIGFPVSLFDGLGARQQAVERQARDGTATLATLAGPSATLCAQMFAHAARVTGRWPLAPAAARLGDALGRFVYADDAWRDLDEDRARGRFNAWRAVASPGRPEDGVCPTRVAAHQWQQLEAARAALDDLELGHRAAPITALLDSLADKVDAIAPRTHVAAAREAGDCDLDCCCPGNCCELECSSCGGESSSSESSGCYVYACLPCCEIDLCFDDQRQERRERRRQRRRAAHAPEPQEPLNLGSLIGRVAEAVTDLTPDGRVRIDGAEFDARLRGGMAASGDALRVVEPGPRGTLIVTLA